MGNPRGFLEIKRKDPGYRPVKERVRDYAEVERELPPEEVERQSSRCMDCGVPFCHGCGCPLANLIPEWNALVGEGHWKEALELLGSTNNFPEFTGRVCPAPCEASCTVGLHDAPVNIRQIERALAERGFAEGWIPFAPPAPRKGGRVAVVGSGPAGLALADTLNKLGRGVTVYERDGVVGGLLRRGIPEFKLDKNIIERRVELMRSEGVVFETGVAVGADISGSYLLKRFDAIAVACGAEEPRDLKAPGRELDGVHFAMDFLAPPDVRAGKSRADADGPSAKGKKVLVIGGGDTGSDCVGTSARQGAESVVQIEIMPEPPSERSEHTPWPDWPYKKRTSSSHEEGCERMWNVMTKKFIGAKGKVTGVEAVKVEWETDGDGRPVKFREVPGSKFKIEADLILLAMGFVGVRKGDAVDSLGLDLDDRGNVKVDERGASSVPGVFAAGDAATGASLVVRAIAAGRKLAFEIDEWLARLEEAAGCRCHKG